MNTQLNIETTVFEYDMYTEDSRLEFLQRLATIHNKYENYIVDDSSGSNSAKRAAWNKAAKLEGLKIKTQRDIPRVPYSGLRIYLIEDIATKLKLKFNLPWGTNLEKPFMMSDMCFLVVYDSEGTYITRYDVMLSEFNSKKEAESFLVEQVNFILESVNSRIK